ncbi:MAG: polyphosphate kinase 1 [Alkalispirochaeta sp.]
MSGPYINRELSWIEFNGRVLSEAENAQVPLLERLKFLSIVASNFDEFFMVRVATVKRQHTLNKASTCPTGMSPKDQLTAIRARVTELSERTYRVLLDDIFPALAENRLVRVRRDEWDSEQQSFVKRFFRERVFPVLTPVRAMEGDSLSAVGNLRLHAAFLLEPSPEARAESVGLAAASAISETTTPADAERTDGRTTSDEPLMAIVQVPPSLERVVYLPTTDADVVAFTFLEQVILSEAYQLFPGFSVTEQCLFRVTRDADFGVDEERDEDFVEAMEQVIETRDRSDVVRLNINRGSQRLRRILTDALLLEEDEVYESADPLELRNLMDVVSIDGFAELRDPPWKSMPSPWVEEDEAIWDSIRKRDILLHHPYESFDPVVRMVQEAADDPQTLAIKMTLYRTSGNSPIIKALERAAENGKQVSVLVELKARFDEERNIGWAQRLERAGVIVVYGIARLKVHAKAMLIIRRERHGVRRYVHLGTGNYNDKTAKLYTDLGLMSCDDTLCYEVGRFFNAITGYSVIPGLQKLAMAPVGMKRRIIELIRREASRAQGGGSGLIIAKMNSLADPEVIDVLYEASRAGVEIRLNVRGICMLVPGIAGVSETISVVSVVDRYLEHSRAFYFENGGSAEVYLASADWMPRNLEKRVELMFPVENPDIRRRLRRILDLFFQDDTKAHRLLSDGTWHRIDAGADGAAAVGEAVRAQEAAYRRIRDRLSGDEPQNRQEFKVRRKPPK